MTTESEAAERIAQQAQLLGLTSTEVLKRQSAQAASASTPEEIEEARAERRRQRDEARKARRAARQGGAASPGAPTRLAWDPDSEDIDEEAVKEAIASITAKADEEDAIASIMRSLEGS